MIDLTIGLLRVVDILEGCPDGMSDGTEARRRTLIMIGLGKGHLYTRSGKSGDHRRFICDRELDGL